MAVLAMATEHKYWRKAVVCCLNQMLCICSRRVYVYPLRTGGSELGFIIASSNSAYARARNGSLSYAWFGRKEEIHPMADPKAR